MLCENISITMQGRSLLRVSDSGMGRLWGWLAGHPQVPCAREVWNWRVQPAIGLQLRLLSMADVRRMCIFSRAGRVEDVQMF